MDKVRYFYRTEIDDAGVERIFTVAYTYSFVTGEAQYGATVFRRRAGEKVTFIKAPHRQTALARLTIRPVYLNIPADSYLEVENRIREAIRTYGVRGKDRVVNTPGSDWTNETNTLDDALALE